MKKARSYDLCIIIGVTFPLMAKSDVNGENANEIFKWLYSEKPFAVSRHASSLS